MKWRYFFFLFFSVLIFSLSWIYVICFCGVYNSSVLSWVSSGFLSVLLDNLFIQILLPMMVALIRYLAVTHKLLL